VAEADSPIPGRVPADVSCSRLIRDAESRVFSSIRTRSHEPLGCWSRCRARVDSVESQNTFLKRPGRSRPPDERPWAPVDAETSGAFEDVLQRRQSRTRSPASRPRLCGGVSGHDLPSAQVRPDRDGPPGARGGGPPPDDLGSMAEIVPGSEGHLTQAHHLGFQGRKAWGRTAGSRTPAKTRARAQPIPTRSASRRAASSIALVARQVGTLQS